MRRDSIANGEVKDQRGGGEGREREDQFKFNSLITENF